MALVFSTKQKFFEVRFVWSLEWLDFSRRHQLEISSHSIFAFDTYAFKLKCFDEWRRESWRTLRFIFCYY